MGGSAGGREPNRRSGFAGDEQATMLMISGVVLTLGFLVMATTLVTLNNLEGDTRASTQTRFSDDVEHLLQNFNETLVEAIPPQQPDIPYFLNVSHSMEAAVQQEAAVAGLYASISLMEDPPQSLYQRPARCIAHDPDGSRQGIIMGLLNETNEWGVAGAAYQIYITDNRNTFMSEYYLKLAECAQDLIHTHAIDALAARGTIENLTYSTKLDDRSMNLTETNEEPETQDASPTIDTDSFLTRHWNQPANLLEEDGQNAKHVSQESDHNYIRFNLLAPQGMRGGDTLEEPQFHVIASHSEPAAPGRDQQLRLRVYYPSSSETPRIEKDVGPLNETLQQFDLDLTESPTGGANWTYDEIVYSRWELTVVGAHNPGREIFVDHFNMTGGLATLMPYRVEATLPWQEIPYIFAEHDLIVRYKLEPGTPDETFRIENRDVGPGGNSTWWTVTTLSDTQGAWEELEVPLSLEGDDEKNLDFRIVDNDVSDTQEGDDEDTIQIDVLRVKSRIPPAS